MTKNSKAYLLKTVIIASEDEQLADIDKNILRTVGYRANVLVYTSGIDLALRLVDIDLAHLERDTIVFCHRNLSDMTAEEFIDLMRLHPLAIHQPIIAIASNPKDSEVFKQKTFSKVIERPLSVQMLEEAASFGTRYEEVKRKQLKDLMHSNNFNVSSKEFFKRLGELQHEINLANPEGEFDRLSPAQALYAGYDLLRDKNVNKAIPVLLKALGDESVQPQASLALAKAYAVNKKPDLVKKYLTEAIQAYAYTDNQTKMLDLVVKYKARFSKLENPLIADAQRYIREKRVSDFIFKLQSINEQYPMADESNALVRVCLDNEDATGVAQEMATALGEEFSWIGDVIRNSVSKGVNSKHDQNHQPDQKIDMPSSGRAPAKAGENKPAPPVKTASYLNPPSEAETKKKKLSETQKERNDSMLHQIAFNNTPAKEKKPLAPEE